MTRTNISSLTAFFGRAVRSDRLRLIRYLVAGVAISLGYTITIVALVDWLSLVNAEVANVISLILWTIISYRVHRQFTFRFDGAYGKSMARFIFIFGLKMVASIAVIAFVTRNSQNPYLIGVVANWIVLPLVSYVGMKLWVFRSHVQSIVASSVE